MNATQPTTARPGSEEKVRILEERAARGLELWNPNDFDFKEVPGSQLERAYRPRRMLLPHGIRLED